MSRGGKQKTTERLRLGEAPLPRLPSGRRPGIPASHPQRQPGVADMEILQ